MEQLLPRLLLEVPDGTFRNPVLKMGVHATVRDALTVGITVSPESIVCKSAIVTVVVLD